MRKSPPRYLHFQSAVYSPLKLEYTKGQQKTITRTFDKNSKEVIKDCTAVAVQFGGRLNATPQKVSYKDAVTEINAFAKSVGVLEDKLRNLSLPNRYYLDAAFRRLKSKLFSIASVHEILHDLENASIDTPTLYPKIMGKKDQQWYWAVRELARIWKKYKRRNPTIVNKLVLANETTMGLKDAGPFIDFVIAVLTPPFEHIKNRRKKNEQPVPKLPSLPAICKDIVTEMRRSSAMEKK